MPVPRTADPLLARKAPAHHRDRRGAELVFVSTPPVVPSVLGLGSTSRTISDRRPDDPCTCQLTDHELLTGRSAHTTQY
jgi:hypothetical protein